MGYLGTPGCYVHRLNKDSAEWQAERRPVRTWVVGFAREISYQIQILKTYNYNR